MPPEPEGSGRVAEATTLVRDGLKSGEIELANYDVKDAWDQRPFNELHDELRKLSSVSV